MHNNSTEDNTDEKEKGVNTTNAGREALKTQMNQKRNMYTLHTRDVIATPNCYRHLFI